MEAWATPVLKSSNLNSNSKFSNGTSIVPLINPQTGIKSYSNLVNFLCICVVENSSWAQEGRSLSREMSQATGMGVYAINGYVDNAKNLPRYGQLGCSGFIIFDKSSTSNTNGNGQSNSDSDLKLIEKQTSSFLDLKDIAFDHVETILDAVVSEPLTSESGAGGSGSAISRIPYVCPGENVELKGLVNRPELNGAQGICVKYNKEENSFVIFIPKTRKQHALKSQNLKNLSRANAIRHEDHVHECCHKKDSESNKNCSESQQKSSGYCPESGILNDNEFEQKINDQISNDRALANCKNLISTLFLPSVGVQSMDDEHKESLSLLKKLVSKRTKQSLFHVKKDLEEHFAHEEALFKKYNFGNVENPEDKFSASGSHIKEHRRMVKMCNSMLERVGGYKEFTVNESDVDMVCSTENQAINFSSSNNANAAANGKKSDSNDSDSNPVISPVFIERLLEDFVSHVEKYDSMYESHMRAKGAV